MNIRSLSAILYSIIIILLFNNNLFSQENIIKIQYIINIDGINTKGTTFCSREKICDIRIDPLISLSFYLSGFNDDLLFNLNCFRSSCLLQDGYAEPKDSIVIKVPETEKHEELNSKFKIYYGIMTKSLEYRPRRYAGTLMLKISSAMER
ncbi:MULTISPECIES: hypothetical protein [Agrobacterium]|uniref:hypothetical protein n=1 Tax=Agrobacterium TaxID=357 RepID=UPI0011C405E1|nr:MULTISPECIES: hypothetical protein [Agrobacterium]